MQPRLALIPALSLSLLALSFAAPLRAEITPAQSEHFELKIRPLLAKNCFSCHTQSKMGGLALNSREALLTGGKSGPAIKSGAPTESLLIQALHYANPNLKMPPAGKLPDADIELLASWIKDGAYWPEHKAAPHPASHRLPHHPRTARLVELPTHPQTRPACALHESRQPQLAPNQHRPLPPRPHGKGRPPTRRPR
ncbi:MAG: hypothetical protein IPJ98_10520 [Bryobacterales bacterium]|nr:hypothetical protein [Bryobacterales bacterium]